MKPWRPNSEAADRRHDGVRRRWSTITRRVEVALKPSRSRNGREYAADGARRKSTPRLTGVSGEATIGIDSVSTCPPRC
jgi:hypothetical protein